MYNPQGNNAITVDLLYGEIRYHGYISKYKYDQINIPFPRYRASYIIMKFSIKNS